MQFTQNIDETDYTDCGEIDPILSALHNIKTIRSILKQLVTVIDMNPKITDYAHLIDRTKDTALYQHASTLQLFQTINRADGKLELFIFNGGVWHSQGIGAIETIIDMIANPN
jgi:hypothetical protein